MYACTGLSADSFCPVLQVFRTVEFRRTLPKFRISTSSNTIGASVVHYNNDIHDKYTTVNRKPEHTLDTHLIGKCYIYYNI